jgi:hypothetical protein
MTRADTHQGSGPKAAALELYRGKWVALRADEVVASADTLPELRKSRLVRREDAVFVVPERPSYSF